MMFKDTSCDVFLPENGLKMLS